MIVANGQAAVTATANTTPGSYGVTASAAGSATAADFALTNSPHSLVVDTVLDELDPPDGKTSLREALAYAESLPGPEHHHLRPGSLWHHAPDDHPDRRPADVHRRQRHNPRPGVAVADNQRRWHQSGVRHRGRKRDAVGADGQRRQRHERRRPL